MHTLPSRIRKGLLLGTAVLCTASVAWAQTDVTQPGDAVIASSPNSPPSEGVANAIDNNTTKYLNFDSGRDGAVNGFSPSGFVVTPAVGPTRVTGISMQSANDGPERDPRTVTIEGSNDNTITGFNSGNWTLIAEISEIPSWQSVFGPNTADHRFKTQTFEFPNNKPYTHYRWTVTETQGMGTANTCCMQIADVELLGTVLPPDVTQPGDPIIASSPNSPPSEGVANAIDNNTTKYLNFDSGRDGAVNGFSPSGFVVSPAIGDTLITGISLQSANDGPERDPKAIRIEGSNDATVGWNSGTWEVITEITEIPSWQSVFGPNTADHRFKVQTFLFDNYTPYRHYRWTVMETQGMGTANTCCMQIAEVELLGTGAPQDITQPGDQIYASSPNSPPSEGVANAIDNNTTKYLNFDSGRDGAVDGFSPSGFAVTPSIGASTVIGVSMQSANDGPERDPRDIRIEGSNDDTITGYNSGTWDLVAEILDIPSWQSVFGPNTADHRFKTQTFYFPNNTPYKHYRWVVTETQGMGTANTCCMQIAEVELLAVTVGAPCDTARFLAQPVNTPVLEGSAATFFVDVNGPWPLQWHKNGAPIPGATQRTLTTDPITAANTADLYSVEIVGCEMSGDVQAVLFTPSATESIGVNFEGSGANAAPTAMLSDDIAGVHLQGYWNNAAGATGTIPNATSTPPVPPLLNSNNEESTITFNYNATGTWGSGTGEASSTQRLLNGLAGGNAVGEVSTLTFGNVPAGTHSVIAYHMSPPLQFQNVSYNIGSTTYYIRAMNSDEYNAAPGYYRGSSTIQTSPSIANFVRFDNVQPVNGEIVLTTTVLTGADRETGVTAVQLLLNSEAAPPPPAITAQPQPTTVVEGNSTQFSVTATGDNLTYQWRKNNRTLPNGGNISGATTATLTIANATPDDAGIYSVAVFNEGGSQISKNASLSLTECDINEALASYLKFDETSGTTAANSAPAGDDAAITGTPVWAPGQIANAMTLDGLSGAYGLVPDYPKSSGKLSVSGWLNTDGGTFSPAVLIRNGQGALAVSGGNSGQFEFVLDVDANFAPVLTAAIAVGPSIIRLTAPQALALSEWHHVAFTADGAQLRLFVNGQQVASADYVGNINAPQVDHLSIGARLAFDTTSQTVSPDLTAPNYYRGSLDDWAIWNRALTPDEVSRIFAAGDQAEAVTTVTVDCPPDIGGPTEVTLEVTRSGNNVTISWEGSGTLQSAPTVEGPWDDVTGVTGNSHTVDASTGMQYFRVEI